MKFNEKCQTNGWLSCRRDNFFDSNDKNNNHVNNKESINDNAVQVEELEDNEVVTEIFKQNDNTMVGKRVKDIDDVPIELTNRDVVEGYKNK